ncbi:MAG: LamG domain-containing protein, partial [Deltaproteobacteria bacterium]|nr:LamG domain-containing protein [Deltaproteobacteria bacterium]
IEVPHAPEIHFARTDESFTVELWVRAGAGDAESVLLEKWSGIGSYPYALRYRPAGGEIVFARSTGAASSTAELVSTADFDDGKFHHLAAVKDGPTLRLYVDGALAGEMADPITSTIRGESALYVGSRGGTSHFFTGTITELRLWRRARTAAEIDAGRWQRLSGGEVDLAGYWPLDAVAGGQVADGLPRPTGTISGAAWIDGLELPLRAADAAVETAPAAGFDGLESVVRVAADPALMPAATITVEAWVRPEAAGDQAFEGPVVSCGDAVSGWALRSTGAECGFLLTLDGRQHQVRWPSVGGAGRWLHLAGVYDGEAIQLYVHGVPV